VEHTTASVEDIINTIKDYTIVIQAEQLPVALENQLNLSCRQNKVKHIVSYTKGLVARLFVDLGEQFTVIDKDGEEI